MDMVTGGCGFIGSHLADRLENPLILDIKTCKGSLNRNILDPVDDLVNEVERIFHLAALPGVRFSVDHPKKVSKVNIEGTLNLLESARKNDVEAFIFASSSSVYGDAKRPTSEDHHKMPKSPYAVSKLAGEKYCQIYNELYGLKTVTVRPFTVYGERMRDDLAITIFAKKMMEGESPVIFGDGLQRRDFTYVGDVVEGMIIAAEKGKGGQAYNIGAGKDHSVLEMVSFLNKILGKSIEPKFDKKREGDVKNTLADNSKLKELGWRPKIDLKEGLEKVVEWLKGGGNLSRNI